MINLFSKPRLKKKHFEVKFRNFWMAPKLNLCSPSFDQEVGNEFLETSTYVENKNFKKVIQINLKNQKPTFDSRPFRSIRQ